MTPRGGGHDMTLLDIHKRDGAEHRAYQYKNREQSAPENTKSKREGGVGRRP